MKTKIKLMHLSVDILIMTLLVWLDRFTKNLAVEKLKDKEAFVLFKGIFELRYLENRGAAFGMLQNKKAFFIAVTCIFILIVFYTLIKMPTIKKYYVFEFVLCALCAGAFGNMYDRVFYQYVVDFFYFVLIDFPIFNMADIYVTCGCVAFAIITIFVFKENDFDFLSFKKKDE